MTCPCCDPAIDPDGYAPRDSRSKWTALCDPCLAPVVRLSVCPHQRAREIARPNQPRTPLPWQRITPIPITESEPAA